MQTIEIQNTEQARRAFAIALAAIETLASELNVPGMAAHYDAARFELQLIFAAMHVQDAKNRRRATGSGARAS